LFYGLDLLFEVIRIVLVGGITTFRQGGREVAGFPEPRKGTVFYEDSRVYACLAFEPIVEGHTIVAWKERKRDISHLDTEDYQHLMEIVQMVRNALLVIYDIPKVYVAYLDEVRHVHWHLFPRKEGGETGFSLLAKPHGELTDLSVIPRLQRFCGVATAQKAFVKGN